MRPAALTSLLAFALAACAGGGSGGFVPRSDYPIPPEPSAFTEPGDCQGGSRLAAARVEPPTYPARAYRAGSQGWVALRLDIDPEGRTRRVKVIDALPRGPFDGAARGAVKRWRFQPPGEPGLERCVVIIDFQFGVARILSG